MSKVFSKQTIIQIKSLPIEWEKIFGNDTPDKILIYKIFRKHIPLNRKQQKTQFKK